MTTAIMTSESNGNQSARVSAEIPEVGLDLESVNEARAAEEAEEAKAEAEGEGNMGRIVDDWFNGQNIW